MNAADTTWVLVSTALVLLMTPGLALFYGGMVSRKNVLSTLMHSVLSMGITSLWWVVIGYSLAFGPGNAWLGDLSHVGLAGVGVEADALRSLADGGVLEPLVTNIPHLAFMAFQMMVAVVTPAIISGAYAERMKFTAYVLFTLGWLTLVYAPIAHWVWHPHGWIHKDGGLDYAGGLVVHASAGVSALVAALLIKGRRKPTPPHHLPLVLLGAGLLWFGWFGFNAGRTLTADGVAALALVNTHLAAAAAMVSWMLAEYWKYGMPTALGAASGLLAGLVVITPCAGYVGPMSALFIGVLGGGACFGGILLKARLGYDDALDAFGVHGIGGILGGLLLGVFASTAWNSSGQDGLLAGSADLLLANLKGTVAGCLWAALATFLLLKLIDRTVGLRVDHETEVEGLDQAIHGEKGYDGSGLG